MTAAPAHLRRLAGLVAALSVAAVTAGCGILGGGDTYQVTAYFPRAVSIFPSSDVRVLGLPSGEVTEVVIDGDRVRVELAIDSDVPLPLDVTAEIIPQSLIGERYIQLSPAYRTGEQRAPPGHTIDLERTIVPVEPDEALEALREFLDSLDPDGLGNLVDNLEETLRDQGEPLGEALGELSELVGTFAENDETLVRIVDSFDRLTGTLATRERQLGEVLASFAEASQILADERRNLETFVEGLARVSEDGLDLITDHAARLRDDIETVTVAGRTIVANLDAVSLLLDAGPLLVSGHDGNHGILGAYNHELRAINLRNSFSPVVLAALRPLFEVLGLELPCIEPVQFDVVCAQAAPAATAADLATPASPSGDVPDGGGAPPAPSEAPGRPGTLDRAAAGLRSASAALLGLGR